MKGTAIDFLLSQVRNSQTALTGGSVTFYSASTSQLKSVFLDRDMTIEASNPYNLDATATAALFGIGLYRMVIKDVHGSTVFDRDNIYVGVDPDNLPTASTPAAPNKNLANNGSFYMWTLGSPITRTTNVDKQLANEWYWTTDGTVAGTGVATKTAFTAGQTAVPDEPTYYMNLNRTVAVTGSPSYERISNRLMDVGRMAGKTINIAFWAKSTTGGTGWNISVRQDFGSGGTVSSAPSLTAFSPAIPVGTWQHYSLSLTLPSISGKTIGTGSYTEIGFAPPAGSTFNVDFSHTQIEFGNAETGFEYLRSGEDYARTVGLDSGDVVFNTITSTVAPGTSPLTVTSGTKVINLNADKLDDQDGQWWMPPAAIMPFARPTAPAGWLKCDGSPISRTGIYADLFAAISTTYGVGDGSTTFNVPDLRGVFIRGYNDGSLTSPDSGRAFNATVQPAANLSHTHSASQPTHNHTATDSGHAHAIPFANGSGGASYTPIAALQGQNTASAANTVSSTANITVANVATPPVITVVADGTTEARPVNIALLYCIKY